MEQSNKIERSEAWNNIYEVLARLDLNKSTGDAMDRPSAATEIEALFLKLLALQNVVESDDQKLEELTEHNTNVVSQFMHHCKGEGYDLPDSLFESFFDA